MEKTCCTTRVCPEEQKTDKKDVDKQQSEPEKVVEDIVLITEDSRGFKVENDELKYKPVTHVIFDLDGTLIDSESINRVIFGQLAEKYEKEFTSDMRMKIMGRQEQAAVEIICSDWGLSLTPDEFLQEYHELCKVEQQHPDLLPGTIVLSYKTMVSVRDARFFNKFKPVTHVIFDMDGILLDTESLYEKIYKKIAWKYNKEYTTSIKMKLMGMSQNDAAVIACTEMNLPIKPDEFLNLYHSIARDELTNPDLMPGVYRLVRHLAKHNIPIAIATSGNDWLSAIKTQNYKDLFSLFHHTVYGSTDPEVKNGKPAPDIYLICASRFPDNPNPEQVLVFEDAPNGVEGSVRAGMQVVMIPAPDVSEELRKNATLVLKSMEDFQPDSFGLPPFDD